MNVPPRWLCEERRYVDRCPHTDCPHYTPGINKPLRTKPVCGRVLLDVAELYGGLLRREVAWYLGISEEQAKYSEETGMQKMKKRLKMAA